MERKTFLFALLCVAALLLPACTKDKSYAPREMKVTDAETIYVSGKRATFSARCDYPGKWKAVLEVAASENMASPQSFDANTDGETIMAQATGLQLSTTYFGRIAVSNKFTAAHSEVFRFNTSDVEVYVVTDEATGIQTTSAKCGGNVVDDGGTTITERGICWSTSHNPTVSGSHASSGTGTGTFTVSMTGLTANTKYYVRAYATNSQGATVYGNEVSFTTSDIELYVVTNEVTGIQTTSATCSGTVTDNGGFAVTERGICWSTSHNPTVSGSHASSGTGTGTFTVSMTGLTANTKYYVRAYATNSQNTTVYGNEVSFTTLEKPDNEETFTANGVSFKMLLVEGGTFTMGGTAEQGSAAYNNEKPTHSVTLSSYYMGETEVTQALWQAVMGSNPSSFSGSNLPVEQVSWNDCQQFVTKLNQLCASQLNGRQFALPTEAQWEYAARGGKQSQGYKYSGSDTLGDVAWYDSNSGGSTHAVGTKQANELGLYDMSGNVLEWCQDWYGSYGSNAQTDPTGPATGSSRVFRGGRWNCSQSGCRVSGRYDNTPGYSAYSLGLRLSLR